MPKLTMPAALNMTNFTIRARLIFLSGFLLVLLIGSNVYISSEIVSGRDAILANSSTLEASSESLKTNSNTLMQNTKALEGNSEALHAGNGALKRNAKTAGKLKLVADPNIKFLVT